jgi:MoaA/NifB/PqqE/SkfB family radical SAM enzyme
MNNISKYLYTKLISDPNRWYPFISFYYLTYSCEFRCVYCSDGKGIPYYKLPDYKVELDEAIEIITQIRKYTDYFVLTGGEPLQYPEISKLLIKIKELKFKNFILTTNGFYFDKCQDEILNSIHSLVFSLDSMDKDKSEKLWRMPEGTFDKVIDNINKAHELISQKKSGKPVITISSVVTPKNIEDQYDVYEFAKQKGFEFSASLQLMGVKANPELWGNIEYIRFYNYMIQEKKKGGKIYGSVKYLEYMRDLKSFNCKPFTMLVISPNGTIFYPCLEIGHSAGNIKDISSLSEAKSIGEDTFGPQPKCSNQCQSCCALTFALL